MEAPWSTVSHREITLALAGVYSLLHLDGVDLSKAKTIYVTAHMNGAVEIHIEPRDEAQEAADANPVE